MEIIKKQPIIKVEYYVVLGNITLFTSKNKCDHFPLNKLAHWRIKYRT